MISRPARTQLLVDRDVQVPLILRVLVYGAACVIYFVVIEYFAVASRHPGATPHELFITLAGEALFWLPGFLVLGPLMVHDTLRHSNRLAGPIFSLQREMRRLVEDDSPRELCFRSGDYWSSMADDFNATRQLVEDLRRENEALKSGETSGDGESDARGVSQDATSAEMATV